MYGKACGRCRITDMTRRGAATRTQVPGTTKHGPSIIPTSGHGIISITLPPKINPSHPIHPSSETRPIIALDLHIHHVEYWSRHRDRHNNTDESEARYCCYFMVSRTAKSGYTVILAYLIDLVLWKQRTLQKQTTDCSSCCCVISQGK